MKAYKIDLSGFTGKVREVVSEAVQKKAFELGWGWSIYEKEIKCLDAGALYFWESGDIGYMSDSLGSKDYFATAQYTAITAADFLALETAKEPEFKPFDKVLRRDADDEEWNADWFSHKGDPAYPYYCMASCFRQCIPYEGNEHLIGTTDSPK